MPTVQWARWGIEDLLRGPAAEVLVLTANNRLTRTVTAQLADTLTDQTIELPRIQPWSAWLNGLAFERSFAADSTQMTRVLDVSAARLLWADVIAQVESDDGLIDVEQVALLAQQADSLLWQWQVHVPEAAQTPDYLRFLAWRGVYEGRLHDLGAFDTDRLADRVRQWVKRGEVALPATVVLAGFNEYSPQMRALLEQLQNASVQLIELTGASPAGSTGQASTIVRTGFESMAEQWQGAAHWAREQLTAHPQGRFAIVVPALQSEASLARRVLARVLEGLTFNVAVAPPLAHWPLGRAMLNWLSLTVQLQTEGEAKPALAGQTLTGGGCVGVDSEASARALIDVQWRRWQVTCVTTPRWLSAIESAPKLSQAWSQVQAVWQDRLGPTAPWFSWANRFRQTLVALGFPGDTTQSSAAYQATRALDALLSRLASLDDLLPAPTVDDALQMLKRLAGQTAFQPQRDRHARLDVLGLLEAEGGHWDGVWVMGVTDEVLPAMANPNPLIPLPALSQAGAPRSTPAREFEWAKALYAALCELAPNMVFSWPARDGDSPMRASPLIADLPVVPAEQWITGRDLDAANIALEAWLDESQVALQPAEKIGGGVSVLELQAINPCWAFFRHRLGVDAMVAHAVLPNTSVQRGMLLHKVMEDVWLALGSQAVLLEQQVSGELSALVEQRVLERAAHYLVDWPRALRLLEMKRSQTVILAWLSFEALRPPFRVAACEQSHQLVLGSLDGLSLKVSLDRLDKLPDGQSLLIDYKTGKHLPDPAKDWMGPRLKNVQLLAYVQVLSEAGEPPSALLWGQLHAGTVAFRGLAQSETGIEGVAVLSEQDWGSLDWSAQLQRWRGCLTDLGESFTRGDTSNVVWHHNDMNFCTIRSLLRLHEASGDEFD
jgi:probable DNA repair protein